MNKIYNFRYKVRVKTYSFSAEGAYKRTKVAGLATPAFTGYGLNGQRLDSRQYQGIFILYKSSDWFWDPPISRLMDTVHSCRECIGRGHLLPMFKREQLRLYFASMSSGRA